MNFPAITGYEICGVLGQGGMGTVYLARQLSLNRQVAVKILPRHLAGDESYVARFHQEAKAAAKIKHTGIVQIYDAAEEEGLCYFVMEYVSGETTLNRVRRKGRLDESSSLLIAEAVAVALEYAWSEAKLVHRDLKPDNIVIDGDGTVKVVDLGLAKLVGHSSRAITLSKMMIGTPHYCAPEQARGEFSVDSRADIYSLGATLYHFLVGTAPFADTSGVSAMVKNVTDYLPDPMDCHDDIFEPIVWLIEKMMAKDKNHRQQSWDDVLTDIDRVMGGELPAMPLLHEGASTVSRGEFRAGTARKTSILQSASAVDQGGLARTSMRFRIFLVLAALFTIMLYAAWFRMENRRKAAEIEIAVP